MPRTEDELADYLSRIVAPLVAPVLFNIRPFSLHKLIYYIIFYNYIILYSFANFLSFTVSIYLAKMLSPVVGNTGNTVNMNFCEFAHFGEDKTLGA